MIATLPAPLKFLGRMDQANLPLIGWSLRILRWPFIKFAEGNVADGATTRKAMADCANFVRAGGSLVVFPEGLLSHSETEMRTFKDGAFRLAAEANARIVPLRISGVFETRLR